MKIGIDARFLNESGVGRYLRNLIINLQASDKKNEYFIFLLKKDFTNFKTLPNFHKVMADFAWYGFAEQFKYPKLLDKYQLDIVHFPHFNVPIFYPGKFVVTIHDLIHQHHTMKRATTLNPLTYKVKQIGYQKVFKAAIKNSSKIIVPSDYVKEALVKEWKVEGEKITLTYEAVDDKMFTIVNKMKQEDIKKVMDKFNIKPPFIYYVGNAHPHKNVEGLIRAFLSLRKQYQYLTLVLSGPDHYFWQRIKKEFDHPDIIYTGFIDDQELVALYKSAQCFVLPSFEEGFGLPLLEAMACNCPIVSSNAGALVEVGGEAAIYFDPKDLEEMMDKINLILKDNNLRNQLIKKGQARVKIFSWKKLAQQTLEVYAK